MNKEVKNAAFNFVFIIVGVFVIFISTPYIVDFQTQRVLSVVDKHTERVQQDSLRRERELSEIRLHELREKQRIENEQLAQAKAQRALCDEFDRQWKQVPEASDYCENLPSEQALVSCKNNYVRARAAFWQHNPDSKSCPQIWGMTRTI